MYLNCDYCKDYLDKGKNQCDECGYGFGSLDDKPTVKLIGEDGNVFAIMRKVTREMKRFGMDKSEIDEYMKEAMSGDYDHLLQVTMKYVNVE